MLLEKLGKSPNREKRARLGTRGDILSEGAGGTGEGGAEKGGKLGPLSVKEKKKKKNFGFFWGVSLIIPQS